MAQDKQSSGIKNSYHCGHTLIIKTTEKTFLQKLHKK
jgi:hypothetical protein